jgi:ribonuclease P protein component
VSNFYNLKGRRILYEVLKRGNKLQGTGIRITVFKGNNLRELFSGKVQNTHEVGSQYSQIGIGITINRRYGSAVERNRAKRRIRAILRELNPRIECGCAIILSPTVEFKKLDYQSAKRHIWLLLRRAGIIGQ